MSIEQTLSERSGGQCELCSSTDNLSVYALPPEQEQHSDKAIHVCGTCLAQIEGENDALDQNHWRCLNDSMWSQTPAVQVMAWRMLSRLNAEPWAQDLLDMLYLEEDMLKWAESGAHVAGADKPRDVNGVILQKGDDVTIIKDLPIKGSSQVIKRGTVVRGIGVNDNDPTHVSGKANGQSMYIIAEYCRKK
ncbi:PhnA domain-containing protein [Aliagarivorans taiwanensis]|uniref:PhnA domain-containing protein n=1 Tax=Aliagarivorans taiwanensis TaxID=561966 RepID=UPI000417029D|nr:alkylphosphonate utilization protein [Aliagarivorans taiwanensis]